MRFLRPEWLALLALVPLLALAAWFGALRRRRALRRFAGGEAWVSRFDAQVSPHRRFANALIWHLAAAALVVAVARPQWGSHVEEVQQAGVDVVVLIDTSLSMAAEDIAPDRLAVVRNGASRLLDVLDGDRVALVTFAGLPALACPLTLDHGAVRLFLDVIEPEVTQVPGTALADALREAVRAFGTDDGEVFVERSRALVLFTDGEDHEGGLEEVLPELKAAGIVVHTVGVGTTRGAPIPLDDRQNGQAVFKKNAEGQVVTTRLEEAALQQLALETGGHYHLATPGGREIDDLARAIGEMAGGEFGSALRTRYRDRFQLPLGLAFVALLLESCLGDRRRLKGGTS